MSKSESELKWISELGKNPPIIAASCDLNGIWRGKRVPLANLEKVLDEVSFAASDKAGQKIKIDKNYVKKNLGDLVKDTDLSKFIL